MTELDVECPECHVSAGYGCRNRKSGQRLVGFHRQRTQAFLVSVGRGKPAPKPGRPARVVQYRATDGTLHDTYQQAQKHDKDTALVRWFDEWIGENSAHGELTATATQLVEALRAEWHISKKRTS
jgi:hypothetical protein